jgi:MFS transporter, DHA2 family, multidrug resistance protein
VFTQELMHYSATQSGAVLLPRTLAMMIASPFVGRLYNRVSPALLVGGGIVLTALGCWMQADITLATSTRDLLWPLAVTGFGFAFLFVPLTTAALSRVARHELAGAAGVNSFVRQVGGSIGLSIFATLFTRFSSHAAAGLATAVTALRPEVAAQVAQQQGALMARGYSADVAHAVVHKTLAGRVALQGLVIGFDKTFLLQTIAFLVVLPLLFFLRVPRTPAPAHVELPTE